MQEGYSVGVGVLGDREIDFVATRGDECLYIQAVTSVADEGTRVREFGNLLQIKDNHPKFVVSLDPLRADEKGIRHLGLRDFLLMEI